MEENSNKLLIDSKVMFMNFIREWLFNDNEPFDFRINPVQNKDMVEFKNMIFGFGAVRFIDKGSNKLEIDEYDRFFNETKLGELDNKSEIYNYIVALVLYIKQRNLTDDFMNFYNFK